MAYKGVLGPRPRTPFFCAPREIAVAVMLPTIAPDAGALMRPDPTTEVRERPIVSVGALAGHVLRCFREAEDHRSKGLGERLLKCRRQRAGEYDPDVLAAIRARGGSDLFFPLTEAKCDALQAWLRDALLGFGRPWALEPTPVPDLPEDVEERLEHALLQEYAMRAAHGYGVDPDSVATEAADFRAAVLDALSEEAEVRAERATDRLEDKLVEGRFYEVFPSFLYDLATYPFAVLKGPVLRRRKKLHYRGGQAVVEDTIVPEWQVVSPFDFYPSPNARTVNDGYVIEVQHWDRAALSQCRGIPGYSTEAVNEVLATQPGDSPLIAGDFSRNALDSRDEQGQGSDSQYRAIVFHGSVQGTMLAEWDVPAPDPLAYYEIEAVVIQGRVVRTVLNPDRLGRRPYYISSAFAHHGSLFGTALPEKIRADQTGVNACLRNALNNAAMSSEPLYGIDLDAAAPEMDWDKLGPGSKLFYHGAQAIATGRRPIEFYQPQNIVGQLIQAAEYYNNSSDVHSGLPRYAHGDQDVGGAGKTARGLAMLLRAASKTIKQVVANIDNDVLRPAVRRLYDWCLEYDPEFADVAGDINVVPKGAPALIAREQTNLERREFLMQTANPVDLPLFKITGRAELYREDLKDLDIDPDQVFKTNDELLQEHSLMMGAPADPAFSPPPPGAVPPDAHNTPNSPAPGGGPIPTEQLQ